MKKLLCLLAMLAALLTAIMPVYASHALNDALEYLSAAGIKLEYEEETIQPDQRVTRATFASFIIKLLNMEGITCENVYYHDVSSDHWAFNVIGVLTENGIISGNEEKYFRPDDYITRDEAATIIVSVLGYRVYADGLGGYPEGYTKTASKIELFEDTTYGQELTLSDALIMLKNSLDINFLKRTYSDGEIAYIESEDEDILSFYHDMYYAKGVLEGCDGITINSTNRVKDGVVIIDGVEYKTDLTDLLGDIGTRVEFIYEADYANSDERKLVWVKSLETNDILDIQKDEYDSYDPINSVFSYIPEGRDRVKNIKLSKGLVLIYNGAVATGDYDTILNADKYKVRFIKGVNSSVYNIAIVWKYENIVVGKVDLEQKLIYDKFDHSKPPIDISQIREKIVVEGGMVLDQIVEDDVLSIYESEDKTILKFEISKNVREVTGKYIGDEDEDRILFAEDGEYIFFDKNADFSVLYGERVKLYMDTMGYVVWVESTKLNKFPVYLIKSSLDGEETVLKVLDYSGEIEKYRITEKTRIDGTKKYPDEIHGILAPENVTVQQVIILELSDDGSIKSIDTLALGPGETDENSLTKLRDNAYVSEEDSDGDGVEDTDENGDDYIHRLQCKHHGALYPSFILSNDAVMFYPPGEDVDDPRDSDYKVLKKSNLKENSWIFAEVYTYSKDTGYINLLVIKGGDVGGSSDKMYVLVEKTKTAMNEDSDVVHKVIGYQQGKRVEINAVPEYSFVDCDEKNGNPKLDENGRQIPIEPGDVIAITTNSADEIKWAEIKYENNSAVEPEYDYLKYATQSYNPMGIARVHSKIGNILRLKYKTSEYEVSFDMPDNVVLVYDEDEREKIRKGSIWDLTPGDTVVYQTQDENPVMMIVYK